ncbi:MAG: aminotransferase class III-fold pyridoxal phosphate-dependent enzyme, partial [Mesorhizobium sp.]
TMVNTKVYDAIVSGSGTYKGGYTYSGHAVACAAAIAVQHILRGPGFLDNVKKTGNLLSNQLNERFGQHDIRGRGMLMTLELVEDRKTKTPFGASQALSAKIYQNAQARGLITHALSGTVDGFVGDHVVVCPPLIATGDNIDTIVGLLGDSIDAAIQE